MRGTRLVVVAAAVWLLAVVPGAWADHGAGDLFNCSNFTYQEDAQDHLNAHPGDPDRLDQGGVPGLACEDLPRRPAAAPTTTAPPSPTVVATDGCDPNYGLVGQLCVAAAPPDNDCPGLMPAGLRNIPVIGTDVQRLDGDGDRIGCEADDEDGRGRPVVRQQPLSRTG